MTSSTRRLRGAVAGAAAALVVVLGASACQQSGTSNAATGGSSGSSAPTSTGSSTPAEPAVVRITPKSGTTRLRPDQPVKVTAASGTLTDVVVRAADGDTVDGTYNADHTGWTSTGALALKTSYTVRASAKNAAAQTVSTTARLKTLAAKDTADFSLLPSGSAKVGVGMPAVVQFAGLVDRDKQADVEKKVSITTSPKVSGAWGWLDQRQLIWRPKTYWKPGTKVTINAPIAGTETRDGVWTTRDAKTTFTVGSAMVSTVNIATHHLTVRENGRVLRTIPVTTGQDDPRFRTRDGVKVILSRESTRQMDAETTGLKKTDPNYYNVKVKWAMRLTWSGEFLHAAPWSVGSQGRANVSHGCTGMSTANAKWLFDHSKMGDVVKYVGGKRHLESYNGYTMWNMSLAQWASHSALKRA